MLTKINMGGVFLYTTATCGIRITQNCLIQRFNNLHLQKNYSITATNTTLYYL